MKLGPAFFWSLLLAATVSCSLRAVADDPQPQALKPVIFSGPLPDQETAPARPGSIQFDDPFRAPLSFNSKAGNSGPLPPPPVNNHRPAAEKKDWILMTPEEILGVKTPEQILGVESDATSSGKTPEQLFLDRQKRAEADSANGIGIGSFKDSSRWSATKEAKMGGPISDSPEGTFQNLSRILNADRSGNGLFPLNQNSGWVPAAQVLPSDPVQVAKHKADMDEFRALLGEETEKKVVTTPVNYYDSPAQKFKEGSASDPLFANPFGAGAKPMNSTLARPVAPAPLMEWSVPKKKVETPSWAPKPPPWLSQDPSAPVQRRF
jgi:hypothetical protein